MANARPRFDSEGQRFKDFFEEHERGPYFSDLFGHGDRRRNPWRRIRHGTDHIG